MTNELTPLLKYYYEEQTRLDHSIPSSHVIIVIMMVGKFYEIYEWVEEVNFQSRGYAKKVSEYCNIILTKKNKGLPSSKTNPFLCGFPTTHLRRYIETLHRYNCLVAVYDQITPEKNKERTVNEQQQQCERQCIGIFRPSFPMDLLTSSSPESDAMSFTMSFDGGESEPMSLDRQPQPQRNSQGLLFIVWEEEKTSNTLPSLQKNGFMVFLDLEKGAVHGHEWQSSSWEDWMMVMERGLFTFSPREIILCHLSSTSPPPTTHPLYSLFISCIDQCSFRSTLLYEIQPHPIPHLFENLSYQTAILQKAYTGFLSDSPLLTLQEQLHLERYPMWTMFFTYTLQYLYEHYPFVIQHLSPPQWSFLQTSQMLWSRDVFHSLHLFQGSPSLVSLLDKTQTSWGSEWWYRQLMTPTTDVSLLQERWNDMETVLTLSKEEQKVGRQYMALCLSSPWKLWRQWLFEKYSLVSFRKFIQGWKRYVEFMEWVESHPILSSSISISCPKSILLQIQEFVNKEWNIETSIPSVWKHCQDQWYPIQNKWKVSLDSFVESHSFSPYLCFKEDNKYGCYATCSPAKFKSLSFPPPWYKVEQRAYHPQLQRSYEIYQEECRQWYQQHQEYQHQRMKSFREQFSDGIRRVMDWVAQWDVLLSKVEVAQTFRYCRPQLSTSDMTLVAKDMRHPIIERLEEEREFMTNSVQWSLSSTRGYVFFGQNSAGKSTFLKSIALCIWLAQCGCFVPCTSFECSPFAFLFVKLASQDDMYRGQSTFVAEMMELRHVMKFVEECPSQSTLILCDELTCGTEMYSATSLVLSSMEYFLSFPSTFFAYTTHLHWLPSFSLPDQVQICHFDLLTKTFQEGTMGNPIYGIEIAHQLQMPASFLTNAFHYRQSLLQQYPLPSFSSVRTVSKYFVQPKTSRYHSSVYMDHCEQCGGTQGLQTHHKYPQSQSDEKGYIRHFHKNRKWNLHVLCQQCHQHEHHHEPHHDHKISS